MTNQVRVIESGNGSVNFKITKEFFSDRAEAMAYYDITEADDWFWNNFSIEEAE